MNLPAIGGVAVAGFRAQQQKEQLSEQRSLEEHAGTVVGQTFLGTLLKQMRQSPYADNRFSGGSAGGSYSTLLDMQLSEIAGPRLARDLSKAIARSIGSTTGKVSAYQQMDQAARRSTDASASPIGASARSASPVTRNNTITEVIQNASTHTAATASIVATSGSAADIRA